MSLGAFLIMRGATTLEHVRAAFAEQKRLRLDGIDARLGQILLRQGHVDPHALTAALAELTVFEAA
jgi:hypothetical protein